MAIFTKIIEGLGMGSRPDLPPAPGSETRTSGDQGVAQASGAAIASSGGKHGPILQSLERAWSQLLQQDVPGHLQVAPDDALYLERIEIVAKGKVAQRLLTDFIHEFSSQRRIDYVRRELGRDLQRNLVLDQFTGICDGKSANSDAADRAPPSADAFARILADADNGDAVATFEVRLFGHWGERPIPRPSGAEVGTAPVKRPGVRLQLTLWDGEAPASGRTLTVDSYPTVLCRKGDTDKEEEGRLPIAGTYVSARHGVLDWNGAAVTIGDGPSRNGLWLNDARLKTHEPRLLTAGDWLRFSSSDDRDAAHYPRLRVDNVGGDERTPVAGHTPIAPSVAGITPVALEGAVPAAVAQAIKALALLSIVDATGSRQVDVTHPAFRIGRSLDQDYVIPAINAGASREHLVILKMDEQGAQVSHPAAGKRGGRWADGDKETLPASFHWPYGREILLAPDYTKAPPVRLTLRRAV